jgi:RimJ/RimL family protein N-acetyltransferase
MSPSEIMPLLTERLILRLVKGSDEAAIHTYRSNPDATRSSPTNHSPSKPTGKD